nr:unnamed protein product [Meloidogyne enterolobii]
MYFLKLLFYLIIFNNYFCYLFSFSSITDSKEIEKIEKENKNEEKIILNDKDPDRPLMCYRGIKYLIGQEEIDDNISCKRNFLEKSAGMDKFCYKFSSNSGGTEFVKRGCSVMFCTPLGEGCTKMEFEGVEGEMCCCSDTSYCNDAKTFKINIYFIFF